MACMQCSSVALVAQKQSQYPPLMEGRAALCLLQMEIKKDLGFTDLKYPAKMRWLTTRHQYQTGQCPELKSKLMAK